MLLMGSLLLAGCSLHTRAIGFEPPPDTQPAAEAIRQAVGQFEGGLEPAPRLLSPAHQSQPELPPPVVLAWVWHRALEPGEWYEVRIGRAGHTRQPISLTVAETAPITDWLLAQGPGVYEWTVRVIKERPQPGAFRAISAAAAPFMLTLDD
jgi:hypothetical protein